MEAAHAKNTNHNLCLHLLLAPHWNNVWIQKAPLVQEMRVGAESLKANLSLQHGHMVQADREEKGLFSQLFKNINS